MTFEQAYKELEQIYAQLQSPELVDIDRIVQLQQEATRLYDFCKTKLASTTLPVVELESEE
ncbi:exodeoxyribonuclease VII small subunit [bacterium]|nr:exodeoxyribonuclease VII small subunit [bacterium]